MSITGELGLPHSASNVSKCATASSLKTPSSLLPPTILSSQRIRIGRMPLAGELGTKTESFREASSTDARESSSQSRR